MKTLLGAAALAAFVTLGASAVEKWAGVGALDAQSCDQICSHAVQNAPHEQCVKRCQAVRSKDSKKAR